MAAPSLDPAVAREVAATARLIAAAGLVEAFGHVSRRLPGGGLAITDTSPLGAARADRVLAVGSGGDDQPRPAGLPLEAPLHAAIYATRPDVDAIVRGHPPALVAADASGSQLPVTHGLAGLAGQVAEHDDPQLVTDAARATAAAAALGAADCLILSANGALAAAPTPMEAVVRLWFLEERARTWLDAGRPAGLRADELVERSRHWPAELERASRWLEWRYGEDSP